MLEKFGLNIFEKQNFFVLGGTFQIIMKNLEEF